MYHTCHLRTCFRFDTPMNELSLVTDNDAPQGFIINDEAKNEMLRIGRAAHLNHDFQIFQPTFFSFDKFESNAKEPHVHGSPHDPLSSLVSLGSNISGSYGGSRGIGSSRSVDSNISQSSVPSTLGTR